MVANFSPAEFEWTVLPRGEVAAHWSMLYVTMNPKGSIVISRTTHERLGSPPAFIIMFDRFNHRLGLKPAQIGEPNAYPARTYGRRGAKIIRAYRLLTEFGIHPPDLIEFERPQIDPDGLLVLDLRKIHISAKAHSQCRNKDASSLRSGRSA